MNASPLLALLLWTSAAQAQGFAGLGAEVEGFAMPVRGTPLVFPHDHGPHPDYRIEWWYLTATLEGADGTPYGIQWTLFRIGRAPGEGPGWDSPQLWMAHAALTSADSHQVAERLARGGTGQAGVTASPFSAWIDDWAMTGHDLTDLRLTAGDADWSYDLTLRAEGPLVLHGDAGYSVKSSQGQASYYYSQPFYSVAGTLSLGDGVIAVTGQAWLDREWSSQPLGAAQTGWDWFSLSFDTGEKLMGFLLRDAAGDSFSSATWIIPDGQSTAYGDGHFHAEPLTLHDTPGPELPVRWRVTLPDRGLDATVTALNPDAWMDVSIPYWEGPVTVSGSHAGRGYLEMTGHDD
jgi:predicted secreted hydrolase